MACLTTNNRISHSIDEGAQAYDFAEPGDVGAPTLVPGEPSL